MVLRFWPFFASVFFEARFCGFPQHHGLRLLVLIVGGLWFADVVHSFFGSFITHTLLAALQCYTDIAVSVFNDFGHGFAGFGTFCCGFAVFATPQCPPLSGFEKLMQTTEHLVGHILQVLMTTCIHFAF